MLSDSEFIPWRSGNYIYIDCRYCLYVTETIYVLAMTVYINKLSLIPKFTFIMRGINKICERCQTHNHSHNYICTSSKPFRGSKVRRVYPLSMCLSALFKVKPLLKLIIVVAQTYFLLG